MRKLKKIYLLTILFILLIMNLHIFADEEFTIINIAPELFRIGALGEGYFMYSGLTLELYLGQNLLSHAEINYHYSDLFGFQFDIGLGYAFKIKFDRNASYFQFFERRIDDYWVEQITIRGKCKAAWLHMIDFGARTYLLQTEESEYWDDPTEYYRDIILYAGYRYTSYYEVLLPFQEVSITAHVLVGFPNVTEEIGINPENLAFGIKLGINWYFFGGSIGFYGEEFYYDIGFRFPVALVFDK